MMQDRVNAIARAVNERRMESRNVARRKVIELAGDIADVLAQDDPQGFNYADFYRSCGFTGEDIQTAQKRTAVL